MNATAPVSQTPIASDPAQQSASASVNSVKPGGKAFDFAAALRSAGAKPARKAAGHRQANAGPVGGNLPAPGNLSPPTAPPVVAGSAAASAAAIGGTGGDVSMRGAAPGKTAPAAAPPAVSGSQAPSWTAPAMTRARVMVDDLNSGGSSVDSPVAASGAQSTASPGAELAVALGLPIAGRPTPALSGVPLTPRDQNSSGAPVDSPLAASGAQSAASPAPEMARALGLPVADLGGAAAPRGDGAAATSAAAGITVAGVTAAGVAAAARGAAAAVARAASATEGGAAAGTARKPPTAAAATAAFNAATSGPSITDGGAVPSTNTGAWTNTDAAAQAVTAAAMAAAATGAATGDSGFAGAADSPSSPADEWATPAAGGVARSAARPNGAPVSPLAVSVDHFAVATAAKAAGNAPAVNTLADQGSADERALGGTGDSPLLDPSGNAAAGAAQLNVNTAGVGDATPTPTLKVAAGMDTPEFGQGLADRVSWMVDNNLNGAKLQVNPPQLGPIEVRIAVQGNHAQVWLSSHSAVTRDALESSSPKLREMLGAQGFGQVSVDISQRSYQEHSAHPQPYDWTPSANRSPATVAVQSTASLLPRTASGAVDAYA